MAKFPCTLKFPGKTFLTGEYAVLKGGPAVLINTRPVFEFVITKKNQGASFKPSPPVAPHSPAGRFLKKHPCLKEKYHIHCRDPHQGKGGFGFSSAVFQAWYALHLFEKQDRSFCCPDPGFVQKAWRNLRRFSSGDVKPSGADGVSQWLGHPVCVFSHSPFQVSSLNWPFKDLDFILMRTGQNFPTWKHLSTLSLIKNEALKKLKKLAQKAARAVCQAHSSLFLSSLRDYGESLRQARLIHPETQKLLNSIHRIPSVLAAKGTGAMGAETLLLFFHASEKNRVLKHLNLPTRQDVFTRQDLVKGGSLKKGAAGSGVF